MDATFIDRRVNHSRRTQINKMTKAQIIQVLYTDTLTGIGNLRAYEDSMKREVIVLIDVDSLKWVNDNISHKAGDALLKTVAEAFNCCGAEIYRTGGDEFVVQIDRPEDLAALMTKAQALLKEAAFSAADGLGRVRTFAGVTISYGTGSSLELADARLTKHKTIREQIGLRAPRGIRPPCLMEVTIERERIAEPNAVSRCKSSRVVAGSTTKEVALPL